MEVVSYILLGLVFACVYAFGYLTALRKLKKKPKNFDGQIQVDGYELKGLTLELDVPDIAKKPYLIIETKHEDKS